MFSNCRAGKLNRCMFRLATKLAPSAAASLQLAYDSGFRCAEFWLNRKLVQDWRSVVDLADQFPMEYALHFPNRGEFNQKHLQFVVELYHALNCPAMVIHQAMYDRYAQRLFELDPFLALSVENHDLTEHELAAWAEESPWLALDVEHLWFHTLRDGSLKKLLKFLNRFTGQWGDKLKHVHLPGYFPGGKFHQPQYCSRKMVLQVFTLLADAGFEGVVVSETARKYQNPEELQMDVLLHRRWAHQYQQARPAEQALTPRAAS